MRLTYRNAATQRKMFIFHISIRWGQFFESQVPSVVSLYIVLIQMFTVLFWLHTQCAVQTDDLTIYHRVFNNLNG